MRKTKNNLPLNESKKQNVHTLLAAKIIVVSCERSPHSARKVIVKACIIMRIEICVALFFAFLRTTPLSGSCTKLVERSSWPRQKLNGKKKNSIEINLSASAEHLVECISFYSNLMDSTRDKINAVHVCRKERG